MVYQNKMIASIKSQGKILREYSDGVYLPFGTEYSILLKNLNSQKALVDIFVDGRTVINNLIVHPSNKTDNTVEIERFLEDNNNSGHKLKFIEKTDEISEFRGDKMEDGLVRIVYKFEKPVNFLLNNVLRSHNHFYGNHYREENNRVFTNNSGDVNPHSFLRCSNISYQSNSLNDDPQFMSINCSEQQSNFTNDRGITVEGGYSTQQFGYGDIGLLEDEEHVIIIPLKGYDPNNNFVEQVIGSRDKIQCKTCGKKWKSNHKFCGNCGTALI